MATRAPTQDVAVKMQGNVIMSQGIFGTFHIHVFDSLQNRNICILGILHIFFRVLSKVDLFRVRKESMDNHDRSSGGQKSKVRSNHNDQKNFHNLVGSWDNL
jgi:hypothetical protein